MTIYDLTDPQLRQLMTSVTDQIRVQSQFLGLDGYPMFCLLLFGDPRLAHYITNCEARTTAAALREVAERLESGTGMEPFGNRRGQ
jgi:hypothetical protein